MPSERELDMAERAAAAEVAAEGGASARQIAEAVLAAAEIVRKSDGEVLQAASISFGACDFCPAVHFNLIAENGIIFAMASLPSGDVEEAIKRIRKVVTVLASRPSTTSVRQ